MNQIMGKTMRNFWHNRQGSETVEKVGMILVALVFVGVLISMSKFMCGTLPFEEPASAVSSEETSSSLSEEASNSASSKAESAKEENPTTQQPPTVIKQDVTELHFDFEAKDVVIVAAAIAGMIVAFLVGRAIVKAAGIGILLADYFDDKKHRGAYAYNFEGAGGMLKMGYKEFRTLFAENPGRYCVLHDDKRKIVQLILFNPTALFPYKMYFDYNSAYGKGESRFDRHFVNCSYIQLSRHDRKKLAASLRRSRFDSDGARFGTNELSSCGCLMQDANNAVVAAKNTCAQEMEKQKNIISNIAATTPAGR